MSFVCAGGCRTSFVAGSWRKIQNLCGGEARCKRVNHGISSSDGGSSPYVDRLEQMRWLKTCIVTIIDFIEEHLGRLAVDCL
ncbi:hypothetical protein Plhal304r1_c010g0040291 [Plasmopara halstedii]